MRRQSSISIILCHITVFLFFNTGYACVSAITFGFDALEYEVSENQERLVLSVSVQSGAVATPITLYASTIEDTATSGKWACDVA